MGPGSRCARPRQRENNIPRTIDLRLILGLSSPHPAPSSEGCLISVSRCWGGERWWPEASEMRRYVLRPRSKPLAPGAPAARHWGDDARAKRLEAPARRRELDTRVFDGRPEGRARRSAHPNPAAVDNKVSPPGAERSKPHKHRARDAGETGTLVATCALLVATLVHRPAGSLGPRRSARPRYSRAME